MHLQHGHEPDMLQIFEKCPQRSQILQDTRSYRLPLQHFYALPNWPSSGGSRHRGGQGGNYTQRPSSDPLVAMMGVGTEEGINK